MFGWVTDCCCEGCCSTDWDFSDDGFNDGDPWEEIADWHIKIAFEDGVDCGGSNENIQTGTAQKCLDVFEEAEYTINLDGEIEAQNPGFERITVTINRCDGDVAGEQVFTMTRQSTGTGGQCLMVAKHESDSVTLEVGKYQVLIDVSTVDAGWHEGAFWEIQISAD